jgi:glycosyltransferase involved in cell wall biosynthesis
MKILLSAYACEPGRGSEPGVGWSWAVGLADLGHSVWVVTRRINRSRIDAFFRSRKKPANLNFFYFDLPRWSWRLEKIRFGIYLYYLLWQFGAYRLVKERHREIRFDCVHHVTYVSLRLMSFMGELGIPFIFGPVSGGERAPFRLRSAFGFRSYVMDLVRDISNLFVRIDPLINRAFSKATRIYVTSTQSLQLVPGRFRGKTTVQLAIACEEIVQQNARPTRDASCFKVLYMGRFLDLKGMEFGIRALVELVGRIPGITLQMIGTGPDGQRWKKLAENLGVAEHITWVPWVEHGQVMTIMQDHDVLLFPSLHDSGGMVVMEALSCGLPVVCLDTGGPGIIVSPSCGIKIDPRGVGVQEISHRIAVSLLDLFIHRRKRVAMGFAGIERAKTLSWKNLVLTIYDASWKRTCCPGNE